MKGDIIDYDELSELKPDDIQGLQDKVNGKLKEIEEDLQDIINIGDTVDAERRAAFDTDMTPDQIRTYGIKNRLPKAVIYKMLEKYHYITFFKRCKKILDDGEVWQPMGRLGTAEEIAAVAVYLAGDDATFTTGTTISVDGGISI